MNKAFSKSLSDEEFVNLSFHLFPITQQGLKRRFKYRMTNRDIGKLNNICGDLRGKKVLAASGSSIPLFSFLSQEKSPDVIYGFDYSPKQIAYNYLIKYAIRDLSLEDFKDFFGYEVTGARSRKNRKVRRRLIGYIPSSLRKYITYNHELTKRDIKLKACSNCSFFSSEAEYYNIKKNINKIKFFVFNLNTSFEQKLNMLFPDKYFDYAYLSNVLDWICWHNETGKSDIDNILIMLKNIVKDDAIVTVDHLAKRETLLSDYLESSKVTKKSDYNMYTYYWKMYNINLTKINV